MDRTVDIGPSLGLMLRLSIGLRLRIGLRLSIGLSLLLILVLGLGDTHPPSHCHLYIE